MADEPRSLKAIFDEAEQNFSNIESSFDSNSAAFQQLVSSTLLLYEQCVSIANQISLFSANECLEDIGTADLQYLLLDYRIAELISRVHGSQGERKANLEKSQKSYERYLKQLDNYDMLSTADAALLEHYRESPNTFSVASTRDPAARRDVKIKRFREEKALKEKLAYLRKNPSILQNDENAVRELHLTNIAYCTHQAFASLESIGQELHILSLAPSSETPDLPQRDSDARQHNGRSLADSYDTRLDTHLSAGLRGPLLSKEGKPLRPFTLTASGTSKRQEFQKGVFRPDHSLPTMSIDEYLEEERKRGGIIDGGGPQSEVRPEVDEDDMDAADRETYKARQWDEFVEANPRGSGNTLNRG